MKKSSSRYQKGKRRPLPNQKVNIVLAQCILKIRDDDNKNSKKFIKSESSTLLIIQLRNLWPCIIILQLCCMNMRHLFTKRTVKSAFNISVTPQK